MFDQRRIGQKPQPKQNFAEPATFFLLDFEGLLDLLLFQNVPFHQPFAEGKGLSGFHGRYGCLCFRHVVSSIV
jgi:hypothetical protein